MPPPMPFGFALDDLAHFVRAAVFGERFGVVEPRVGESFRQNHCGCEYRSGQTSASGFIASGFTKTGVVESGSNII